MIEISFSIPYLDQHPFLGHIRDYESYSMMVGIFMMETNRSNSFCINISFSIKAFSSFYVC